MSLTAVELKNPQIRQLFQSLPHQGFPLSQYRFLSPKSSQKKQDRDSASLADGTIRHLLSDGRSEDNQSRTLGFLGFPWKPREEKSLSI